MDVREGTAPAPLPYSPSWFDRFSAWLDRLPGATWLYFLGAAGIWCALFLGIQASQGAYTESGFYPWHIFLAVQPIIVFAMMHYLDRVAIGALADFQPAMASGPVSVGETRYRLTTLPAKRTWIATIAGALTYLALFGPSYVARDPTSSDMAYATALQSFGLSATPASGIVLTFAFLLIFALMGVLIYHTVHQLNVVRSLFIPQASVNPFKPEPLYAFSTLTGLTAGLLLLNSYGWLWGIYAGPAQAETVPIVPLLALNAFFAALSLALFVWPLWGAHRILSRSKQQALARNADLYLSATVELHKQLAEMHVEGIDNWHRALVALDLERSQIEKLPTWPWRPETLRGLVGALLLPVVIWLLQRLLERFID